MGTLLLMLVLFTLVVVIVLLLGLGWYVSSLGIVPEAYQLFPEFTIQAATQETVTLPYPNARRQFADPRKQGDFALLYENGWGVLGDIIKDDGKHVWRRFQHVAGAPPRAGEAARLDTFYYRRDPKQDLGLDFQTLSLSNGLGTHTAWWLPHEGEAAVLMLHGRRRGELCETLRAMSCLQDSHVAMLAISYRNHRGSPMSPDGFYHYGQTEWRDAMVGLEFLLEQGYKRIVIFGISTGCALAHELFMVLKRQGRADGIKGFIFDSPLLDAAEIMHQGGRNANVPAPLTGLALFIASVRSGIDWQRLNHRRIVKTMQKPTLLIAGTKDATVPIELCDDYATLASDYVDYWRVEGAGHVEAWNLHREGYKKRLQTFVRNVIN